MGLWPEKICWENPLGESTGGIKKRSSNFFGESIWDGPEAVWAYGLRKSVGRRLGVDAGKTVGPHVPKHSDPTKL